MVEFGEEGFEEARFVDAAEADVAVEVAIGAFGGAEWPVDVNAEAWVGWGHGRVIAHLPPIWDRRSRRVCDARLEPHAYVEFCDERVEPLIGCHERAFAAFGGVPSDVLYDNMKTVALERNTYRWRRRRRLRARQLIAIESFIE